MNFGDLSISFGPLVPWPVLGGLAVVLLAVTAAVLLLGLWVWRRSRASRPVLS